MLAASRSTLPTASLLGFRQGVITLNLLEADDITRAAMQAEMREPYRTLLGHFRHESGHYYWSLLRPMPSA